MTRFSAGLSILCCLLSLSGIAGPAPAKAQQAVWDPEEIARLAEKSAQMSEALSRAVELLNNVDQLSRTIGRFGALSNLDFARFDTLEGLKGAGPEISGLASNIAAVRQMKISSFDDASTFVHKLLAVPSDTSPTTGAGQVRQALDSLYRKALEDGYTLSTHTRETVSVAPQRAKVLVAEASASADLRGDVGANTAAAMAVLDQMGSLKAALAAILEIQSAGRLAQPKNSPSSK
ncbi:hypothetical protein [Telmatospirillum siberiense]|uniref:Chemotaxis protein n=1 Tax=Telmatospirillum siberiense TaxID=382514 RepID=A0A2N3PQY9_9PROT|nr:hypothetical protein [Telmatospirillum siberiense]PKU22820.1 hypothetical protein CWS72_19380 [Telmatospirillum siberiense]